MISDMKQREIIKLVYYKTKLCKNWHLEGCKDKKCDFAHGEEDQHCFFFYNDNCDTKNCILKHN